MIIRHVWDMAGIGSMMATWQAEHGHDSICIIRPRFDPYHVSRHYSQAVPVSGPTPWYITRVIVSCMRARIIHIHGAVKILSLLRRIYPNHIIIYHGHGTDIRSGAAVPYLHLADKVVVATPDLLDHIPDNEKVTYVPIPVDTDLFAPPPMSRTTHTGQSGMAHTEGWDDDRIKSELPDNVQWKINPRKKWSMSYGQMPRYLAGYSHYAEVKTYPASGQKYEYRDILSTTSLQALSMGLCVYVAASKKWLNGLPPRHSHENVMRQMDRIYAELAPEYQAAEGT